MSLIERIIDYIESNFQNDEFNIQYFDSGYAIVDLDFSKSDKLIVINIEPKLVGISLVAREPHLDFSLPDYSFNSYEEFITCLQSLIVS